MYWLRPVDAWLSALVLPREAEIMRQARRWTESEDEARDLVQQAYAGLLSLGCWDHIANPLAYMVCTVRDLALARMRRARVVSIRHFARLADADRPDDAPDAFALVAGREELRRLTVAIEALPATPRRVMELRKFEDMPPDLIAERLEISPSAVEAHLARGLALLTGAMRADPADPPALASPCDAERMTDWHDGKASSNHP